MRALVLVVALTGCNLVFGVDATTTDAPDAPAANVEISGTLARTFIHNDLQGMPIVETGMLDPTKNCPTAFLGDTALDVTCDTQAGTFGFTAPEDARYRLFAADADERITAARTPGLTYPEWGRPDQQVEAETHKLHLTLLDSNDLAVTASFGFNATGVYAPPSGASATAGAAEIKWEWPLLDGARGDRLYAYRERLPDVSRASYIVTGDRGEASVSMQAGADTSAIIKLLTLPTDRCVRVALDVAHHEDRLAQAVPGTSPWQRGYLVYSAPSPEQGPGGLGDLARDVADLTGGATPSAFDARDPYPATLPGQGTLLFRVIDRFDTTTLAYAGIRIFDRLAAATCTDPATCCEEPSTFPDAALPTDLRLGDVPLTTANQVIGLGASEAPVMTWTLGAGAPVDRVQIVLLKQTAPATLAVVYRWYVTPDQDHVAIDPALLEPSTTYLVQVQAESGYPGAAEGRFAFPLAYPLVSSVSRAQPFMISK